MAVIHAKFGEVIDVRPLGAAMAEAVTSTVMKTEAMEILRFVVPAGKVWPTHAVAGEITVHCLEGRIAFTAGDATVELGAGRMLALAAHTRHSLRGIEAATVLVTILLPVSG